MGHSDIAVDWSLSSTNGYALLSCTLRSDEGVSLVHSVRLDYRLPGDELPTASATVLRLALSRDRLGQLVDALRSWLGQPLDAIRVRSFDHSGDLAEGPSESLNLVFGSRDDVITGVGEVGCLVELRSSTLRSCLAFGTDLTCLELLAEDLERVLSRSSAERHKGTKG